MTPPEDKVATLKRCVAAYARSELSLLQVAVARAAYFAGQMCCLNQT